MRLQPDVGQQRSAGFTLIEILTVLAVMSVLLSLALPAVQAACETSRKLRCQSNLRQLGLAFANYHEVNQVLPMGSSRQPTGSFFKGSWGFTTSLLPYLEQRATYSALKTDIDDCCQFAIKQQKSNQKFDPFSTAFELLACPSDPLGGSLFESGPPYSLPCGRLRTSNYLGVSGKYSYNCIGTSSGTGLLFSKSSIRYSQVTDGTSYTLLCGERGVSDHQEWVGLSVVEPSVSIMRQ